MTLKLFGHDPSPFVRCVRVLLLELGIPFDRDTNGWLKPTAEFEAASPIRRLPMLDRGSGAKVRYVYDSLVIASVAYDLAGAREAAIETVMPSRLPLQPTLWNSALEQHDQNVYSAIDAVLDSAVNLYLLETDGVTKDQSAYLRRQDARVRQCLDWIEQAYEGRPTLSPGQFAYVDIAVAATVGWLRFRKRADVDKWPGLVAVETAHEDRNSFASTRPT